jgi:hypothetical protein
MVGGGGVDPVRKPERKKLITKRGPRSEIILKWILRKYDVSSWTRLR